MLTLAEKLRIVKAICDDDRQKPQDQQSPAIAREARRTADVLIHQSECERATRAWLRGAPT